VIYLSKPLAKGPDTSIRGIKFVTMQASGYMTLAAATKHPRRHGYFPRCFARIIILKKEFTMDITIRKKKRSYSLILRLSAAMVTFYVAMIGLFSLNNYYTISAMQDRIYDELYDSLATVNQEISDDLGASSTYMATFMLDTSSLSQLEQNKKDTSYYSTLYNVKTALTNTLSSLSSVQGLFVFPSTSQEFIYAATSTADNAFAQGMRDLLRSSADTGDLDGFVSKSWYPIEIEGKTYLVRVLHIGSSYLGAWTDFSTLLSQVNESATLETIPLFIAADGSAYGIDSEITGFSNIYSTQTGKRQVRINGISYIMTSLDVSWADGSLGILVPVSQIRQELIGHYLFCALAATLLLLSGFFLVIIFRNYLSAPLTQLDNSIHALQDGDFSVQVPEDGECREFASVNHAFNEMVGRIKNLKINVYEEKLAQQKTELQALKAQVAPHFLINCLNSIFHMAAAKNTPGIQKMTVCLGNHLRYALADTSVVPLKKEIEMTENYVELSRLRFPEGISLSVNAGESCLESLVPPMIILFQIENIIKYQVIADEITEIHIEIQEADSQTHICIWDTGTGYEPDVLRQLNSQEMLSQADGHNIGTKNIYRRLNLLFEGDFQMAFRNRENAGAQVDIRIPARTL